MADDIRKVGFRPQVAFPYEQLLAYATGEPLAAHLRAEIERNLEMSPRWRTHHDSIRFLDLERLAARQDGKALSAFRPARASALCVQVAKSRGEVLCLLLRGHADPLHGHDLAEWQRHISRCVYCRRMMRLAQAQVVRDARQIREPLLREWLLDALYRDQLDQVTACLAGQSAVFVRREEKREQVWNMPALEMRLASQPPRTLPPPTLEELENRDCPTLLQPFGASVFAFAPPLAPEALTGLLALVCNPSSGFRNPGSSTSNTGPAAEFADDAYWVALGRSQPDYADHWASARQWALAFTG